MITTVAPPHLEAFDSIEGIAHEKAAILDGLARRWHGDSARRSATTPHPDGRAAAGAGPWQPLAQHAGSRLACLPRRSSARTPPSAQASRDGQPLSVQGAPPRAGISPPTRWARWPLAEALGLDPALAAHGPWPLAPPAGRGQRERIITDCIEGLGFDLIDDAFNANPASMAASLEVLSVLKPQDGVGRVGQGRRIAILGDMLELGPTEAALHAAIADHPGLAAIAR
ncbi:MAG: cyanophycin synthetase [Gemmobacter sp.]|nr:cyanophycin synthetase [Gemmobacter sp.]